MSMNTYSSNQNHAISTQSQRSGCELHGKVKALSNPRTKKQSLRSVCSVKLFLAAAISPKPFNCPRTILYRPCVPPAAKYRPCWISSRTGRATARAARSLPNRNSFRSAVSPSLRGFCWRTYRPHAQRTRSEINGWNLRKQNATPGRSVKALLVPVFATGSPAARAQWSGRTTSATSRTRRLRAGPLFMAADRQSPRVALARTAAKKERAAATDRLHNSRNVLEVGSEKLKPGSPHSAKKPRALPASRRSWQETLPVVLEEPGCKRRGC